MRNPPTFQKLDVTFGEETFPAGATLAFETLDRQQIGPAQQITVHAGRGGTWTIVLTLHAPLPRGACRILKANRTRYQASIQQIRLSDDVHSSVTGYASQQNHK